jgi:RNA polymerase sigma-70 factor (ECF subfamily)
MVRTNETELIEGCLGLDKRSQEQLYKRYANIMWGVCLRYSRSREEAEDILQEGFIKVFDNISKFRQEGSFEGWIRRIMVNTALKHYSKVEFSEQSGDDEESCGSIAPEAVSRLNEKDLLNIIAGLPEGYRLVFNLYAIEGYDHKEIASMLGIGESTSRSQLAKARAMLQQKLNARKDKRNTSLIFLIMASDPLKVDELFRSKLHTYAPEAPSHVWAKVAARKSFYSKLSAMLARNGIAFMLGTIACSAGIGYAFLPGNPVNAAGQDKNNVAVASLVSYNGTADKNLQNNSSQNKDSHLFAFADNASFIHAGEDMSGSRNVFINNYEPNSIADHSYHPAPGKGSNSNYSNEKGAVKSNTINGNEHSSASKVNGRLRMLSSFLGYFKNSKDERTKSYSEKFYNTGSVYKGTVASYYTNYSTRGTGTSASFSRPGVNTKSKVLTDGISYSKDNDTQSPLLASNDKQAANEYFMLSVADSIETSVAEMSYGITLQQAFDKRTSSPYFTPKWYDGLSVQVMASRLFVKRNISAEYDHAASYADKKSSAEKMKGGFEAALMLEYRLNRKMSLRTGLSFSKVRSEFEYINRSEHTYYKDLSYTTYILDPFNAPVPVLHADSALTTDVVRDSVVTENIYSSFNVPLLWKIRVERYKWEFSASYGPVINISFAQKGAALGNTHLIDMSSSSNPYRKASFSMFASAACSYRFTQRMSINIEPHYIYTPNTLKSAQPLKERNHSIGVFTGLGYKF